jgi:hypothetical protein
MLLETESVPTSSGGSALATAARASSHTCAGKGGGGSTQHSAAHSTSGIAYALPSVVNERRAMVCMTHD